MTIPTLIHRNDFIGAGATNVFTFGFKILDAADLKITVLDTSTNLETLLVITTDYTVPVADVGEPLGGNITLVDAGQPYLDGSGFLDIGFSMTIRRVRVLTQDTDIRNQGPFLPSIHEDEMDRSIMIAQQQQDEIDRSIKLPETIDPAAIDTELPPPIADQFLRWNSTADAIVTAALVAVGTLVIPPGNGMLAFTGPFSLINRVLTGGPTITVADGGGQAGNPTFSVPTNGITDVQLRDDGAVDANRSVTTNHIRDNAVTTAKINALAVTPAELAANAVETAKILDLNVTRPKLAALAVDASKLDADAVTTVKILDGNVTAVKLASGLSTPARQEAVETTLQTVANVTTEETIFSQTITGGVIGTSGALMFRALLEARSSGATCTYRLKIGGVTVHTISGVVANAGGHFGQGLEAIIANIASESAQRSEMKISGNTGFAHVNVLVSSAVDTSVNQTLELTAQWSVAPAQNPSIRLFYATAFVVR